MPHSKLGLTYVVVYNNFQKTAFLDTNVFFNMPSTLSAALHTWLRGFMSLLISTLRPRLVSVVVSLSLLPGRPLIPLYSSPLFSRPTLHFLALRWFTSVFRRVNQLRINTIKRQSLNMPVTVRYMLGSDIFV